MDEPSDKVRQSTGNVLMQPNFFGGANLIFILWGKSGIIKFEFKTISVSYMPYIPIYCDNKMSWARECFLFIYLKTHQDVKEGMKNDIKEILCLLRNSTILFVTVTKSSV